MTAPAPSDAACFAIEVLLAARFDGALAADDEDVLRRHLALCETCRAVADTRSPIGDTLGDLATLPEVDPAGYVLGLEVARGGMGRILAARDLRVGRPVAVKELLGDSPALAARFEREARVTARLQHPGIVPIYEIGRWPDGTPFYTMRMVDGRTLHAAIASTATLAARIAMLPAVIAATEAVAFAHGARVIHRDLTPANVLVGAYGETVVIDWGLAKDLADATDDAADIGPPAGAIDGPADGAIDGLTGAGAVIGTAAYMPPEQANAQVVDERADVYALGAILYHLLAGVAPYRARTTDELLRDVKAGPPPPIARAAPGTPRDLISIVAKAMSRDPAERYPSARELAEELVRFQAGRMVEAHSYSRGELIRRFVRRHRAAVIVTVSAIAVLGILGGVFVQRLWREQVVARRTVTALLAEEGRSELLAGHTQRALALLATAYERGDDSSAMRFMLASAMREIDTIEATLDCGADVRGIDVSPDGVYLAAACRNVGKLWRFGAREPIATLGPFPEGFDAIKFSPDGNTLVSDGLDGYARVFDAPRGTLRRSLRHGKRVTQSSFTPDSARLVTTGFDGTAQVWDVATGARLRTIVAAQILLFGVHGRLSRDGTTLLTVTAGGTGTGWNIDTGERLGSLEHGSQILGGDVSPDGAMASTCGIDRRVKVWDIPGRREKWTLGGHSDAVWKCVFSPDSARLLTTSNDGTAKVWDLATGGLVTSLAAGDIVWTGTFSADGRRISTSSLDGSLKVWDAASGALLASHDDPFGGRSAQFSRDGARLIGVRADGRITIWNPSGGRLRRDLTLAEGRRLVATSADGTRAVVERGYAIELWDVAARTRIRELAIAEPFALSADGRRLAANSVAGVVVIDLHDGAIRATLADAAGASSLALDRAGTRVLAIGARARVWDVARGTLLARLGDATQASLSDDGAHAVAWTAGGAPQIWELAGDRQTTALAAPTPVRAIGFSRDGRRVALAEGAEGSLAVGLWDTATGARVGTPIPIATANARFDPSGTRLTTIGADGSVGTWTLDGVRLTSFVGEHVSHAQVGADGELVVAIDKRGASVLVLSAKDGGTLARWPILHRSLATEDSFLLPTSGAWWTPDGTSIVAQSDNVTVWDAQIETRSAADIAARVRATIIWRVTGGRLTWANGRLDGRVLRGADPIAGGTVSAVIREVPRSSSGPMTWASTSTNDRELRVRTDDAGHFEFPDLFPGTYVVTARDAAGVASRPIEIRISGETELAIDLAQ